MKIKRYDLIEVIAGIVIIVILAVIGFAIWADLNVPSDRKCDLWSQSCTWTDDEGRRLIQGPDGSVRELSPK